MPDGRRKAVPGVVRVQVTPGTSTRVAALQLQPEGDWQRHIAAGDADALALQQSLVANGVLGPGQGFRRLIRQLLPLRHVQRFKRRAAREWGSTRGERSRIGRYEAHAFDAGDPLAGRRFEPEVGEQRHFAGRAHPHPCQQAPVGGGAQLHSLGAHRQQYPRRPLALGRGGRRDAAQLQGRVEKHRVRQRLCQRLPDAGRQFDPGLGQAVAALDGVPEPASSAVDPWLDDARARLSLDRTVASLEARVVAVFASGEATP